MTGGGEGWCLIERGSPLGIETASIVMTGGRERLAASEPSGQRNRKKTITCIYRKLYDENR